jgi:hypothetical protein
MNFPKPDPHQAPNLKSQFIYHKQYKNMTPLMNILITTYIDNILTAE